MLFLVMHFTHRGEHSRGRGGGSASGFRIDYQHAATRVCHRPGNAETDYAAANDCHVNHVRGISVVELSHDGVRSVGDSAVDSAAVDSAAVAFGGHIRL